MQLDRRESSPFFSQCILFNTHIAPLLKRDNLAFLVGFFRCTDHYHTRYLPAERHSTNGHYETPIISTFLLRFD